MVAMKSLIAAALMLPAIANAYDFGVELHGHAWHRDVGPFNERNPGLGLFARQDTLYLHAGGYKNSFYKPSFYVAAEWLPLQSRWIDAGIGGGVATGYQGYQGDASVAPGGYIKAHIKFMPDLYAAIRYVPPLRIDGKPVTNGLTTASLGWQFR